MRLWALVLVCWAFVALFVVWRLLGAWDPMELARAQTSNIERIEVTVTRVADGDTIEVSPTVEGTDEVRLIGVDTPEVFNVATPEPCGPEASAYTTERLEGQQVSLEFDEERVDEFGRALAYVFLGDELFNETLAREGYAEARAFPPNVRYEDRFVAAESEAMAAGVRLWNPSGPCVEPEVGPTESATPSRATTPEPFESDEELLEAGGSVVGPVPAMPDGGCPEEYPTGRFGACHSS